MRSFERRVGRNSWLWGFLAEGFWVERKGGGKVGLFLSIF